MISLVGIILSYFYPNRVIIFRHLPNTRTLHAHQLGITCSIIAILVGSATEAYSLETGILTAFLILILREVVIFPMLIIFVLDRLTIFIFGTFLLESYISTITQIDIIPFGWLICGYYFGVFFAISYNDFLYFYLTFFEKERSKIIFAYDPRLKINIIKSPIEAEQKALTSYIPRPIDHHWQSFQQEISIDGANNYHIRNYHLRNLRNELIRQLSSGILWRPPVNIASIIENLESLSRNWEDETFANLQEYIQPVLSEEKKKANSQKLFPHSLPVDQIPANPYTIAFIANPSVLISEPDNCINDPIIDNLDLFLNSIYKAIKSFAANEVLGAPEIWPRIRIVAIFDDSDDRSRVSLARRYPYEVIIDEGDSIDEDFFRSLLDTVEDVDTIYAEIVEKLQDPDSAREGERDLIRNPDIIYVLSANEQYGRSTARFTDWSYTTPQRDQLRENDFQGIPYSLDINGSNANFPSFDETGEEFNNCYQQIHEYYCKIPGRVAINVYAATRKTYIHEFAHAMSSYFRGAIGDEYYWNLYAVGEKENDDPIPIIQAPFIINRIERSVSESQRKFFATYNNIVFTSDMSHPSRNEAWAVDFPDRKVYDIGCIMDRNYGVFRFDELIANFMYDRLIAKTYRDELQIRDLGIKILADDQPR